jgi:hypothetical protein
VSGQYSEPTAGPLVGGTAEMGARQKIRALWQVGDLFHVCTRYPRRSGKKVDRLAGILKDGLLAPAHCRDGSVRSDLRLEVTGCSVPYNSLVFLHRFGELSYLYTICEPGRFAVFVDPHLPVLTQEQMGDNWVVLCMDEVYVRDGVPAEKLIGIAVHPDDAEGILRELAGEFQSAAMPLYTYDGNILWPPGERGLRRSRRSRA